MERNSATPNPGWVNLRPDARPPTPNLRHGAFAKTRFPLTDEAARRPGARGDGGAVGLL